MTGMEYYGVYSNVPKLIDFFKLEGPAREDDSAKKQEDLRGPERQQWSTHQTRPTPSCPERTIVDSDKQQLEPIVVDFWNGHNDDHHQHNQGLVAAALGRSPTRKQAPGVHWAVQAANPLKALKFLSPTSTGTEESGTAAPKTPTCDVEIACSRPFAEAPDIDLNESLPQQGSTFSIEEDRHREIKDLQVCADTGAVGTNTGGGHGRKRMNRAPPAPIALPPMQCKPIEPTPTSRLCDVATQTPFSDRSQARGVLESEEDDAVVQVATSLLSLASDGGPVGMRRARRCRRLADVSAGEPLDSEPQLDETGPSSSVLSRPSNKRRYKLMVDLLAETPSLR